VNDSSTDKVVGVWINAVENCQARTQQLQHRPVTVPFQRRQYKNMTFMLLSQKTLHFEHVMSHVEISVQG